MREKRSIGEIHLIDGKVQLEIVGILFQYFKYQTEWPQISILKFALETRNSKEKSTITSIGCLTLYKVMQILQSKALSIEIMQVLRSQQEFEQD